MTQQTTTAKQTESTQQQYAVGDKVRILGLSIFDADEIGKTGVITDGNRELCIGGFGAVVALPNGYKRVYKYENIEKVAEQMAKKFNVGDKVRYLGGGWFVKGEILTVCENDGGDWMPIRATNGKDTYWMGVDEIELVNAKSTQSTPKKKARISALEAQVAELTAKVEALEKAQKPSLTIKGGALSVSKDEDIAKVALGIVNALKRKSPNEQRKAIIAEAKTFIDDSKVELTLNRGRGYVVPFKEGGNGGYICDLEFVVNAEKRTVVALLRWTTEWESHIKAKAIAKCAPDDVFNADIGKAIALGRALGLDVKRFEQAVKPSEFVNGQVIEVKRKGTGTAYLIGKIRQVCDYEIHGQRVMFIEETGATAFSTSPNFSKEIGVPDGSLILCDTDAQY